MLIKRALLVVFTMSLTQVGWATQEIAECGYEITSAGDYELAANIQCGSNIAYAIAISQIQSGKVVLDLKSHKIQGSSNSNTVGIHIRNSKNVEITASQGAKLENLQIAIELRNNNRDIDIDGNGLWISNNDSGIQMNNSRSITLQDVKMSGNDTDLTIHNCRGVEIDKFNP